MESDAQLVSSEFPIGIRLGSDQEKYLATESLSPCSSSEIQQWPLGSLSCWKSARRPRARSDGSCDEWGGAESRGNGARPGE